MNYSNDILIAYNIEKKQGSTECNGIHCLYFSDNSSSDDIGDDIMDYIGGDKNNLKININSYILPTKRNKNKKTNGGKRKNRLHLYRKQS